MNKKVIILIPLVLISGILFGQNEQDALRYSRTRPFSTGLSAGVAGAMGSIGADMGSVAINPAGLGFYRKHEFNLSMGVVNPNTTSDYLETVLADNRYGFTIPNLSYVYTTMNFDRGKEPDDEIVSYSFSFQLHRNMNFYNKTFYQGKNMQSSFLDMVRERSQGYFENELGSIEWLAFQTYLMDYDPDTTRIGWITPLVEGQRNSVQTGIIDSRGGMYDYNVGGGFNFGNKFYAGASIHYHILRFNETNTFQEDNEYFLESFESMQLTSRLKVRGNGVGAKIGAIFRPIEELRLGLSFQSPVKFNITDAYSFEMSSNYHPNTSQLPPDPDGGLSFNQKDPPDPINFGDPDEYEFKYYVTTPTRFTLSASYLTGKFGFVSLDIERVNYANISMGSEFENFLNENTYIKSDFRSVTNFRLGTELLAGDYRIRGGVAHYPSPYNKNIKVYENQLSEWSLSAGLGIRKKNYAFDVAIMQTNYRDQYVPYVSTDLEYPSSTVKRKHANVAFVVTMAFFFDPE